MIRFGLVAVLAAISFVGAVDGRTVNGYVKRDGTYIAPHHRSSPNGTKTDNYSTKGNTNPYTGKEGTVDPYKPTPRKK